ncbi:MAG TPA: ABC transporter permease, partial [Cyclobacteriaceae bacterium]
MKNSNPPRLAEMLFDWFCGHAKVEDLKGDIDELFQKNAKAKSVAYARRKYWKQVISLITSYAIKKRKKDAQFGVYSSSSFNHFMIKNYLKIAVRNIYRHKYFSLINVAGLSIGMSVSLLLISLLAYVNSYDDFHENKETIYSVSSHTREGVEENDRASSPTLLADKAKNEFASAEEIVRINSSFNGEVVLKNENIPLRGYYTDPEFLSLFTFELLEGNSSLVLKEANSIVLTESAANKLFATTDVVGKIVEMKDLGSFQVTGLLKDHPKNSHLRFEALVSYNSLPIVSSSLEDQWTNYRNQYVYVSLRDKEAVNNMQSYLNKLAVNVYSSYPVKASFELQELNGLVKKDLQNAPGPKWEASGFWIFGLISLLILLPACFNYTNISIARALKRSKEIGLRKTMGGLKNQIFFQFLMETIIITLVSLIGALFLFIMARAEFQSMLVDASATDLSLTVKNVSLFILFALLTGTIAGLSPAIYFSRLNPIQALKNQSQSKVFSGMGLRKILTTFQFALTFGFILCLVVFGRQYRHSLNYDFGFHKENILNVDLQDA